jgi:tRNA-splicing ligase RtcB (3'-phosphate/5'-hydroxy nucleic acid ligase)
MAAPAVIDSTHVEFAHYLTAMQLAGEYAYAGRDIVTGQVLEILGAEALDEIHNHHNFACRG